MGVGVGGFVEHGGIHDAVLSQVVNDVFNKADLIGGEIDAF